MTLSRRALPRWYPIVLVGLLVVPAFVDVILLVRIPLVFSAIGAVLLVAFATDAIVEPALRRLKLVVASAPVFAIAYDDGFRAQFEALTDARVSDSMALLVVQPEGIEVWSLDREPNREAVAPWTTFAGAKASATGTRRRIGTVELLWPDGAGSYFDVRVSLVDWIRRSGSNAAALARAFNQHITPAQPDPAHTRPRAQTG